MKNKNIFRFILLTAILFLTSCTSEHAFENEDYKKIKEEYKEFEEVISRYGYLKEDLRQHRTLPTRNKANSAFANYNETAHITPAKPAGRYAGLSRKVRPFG